MNTGSVGTKGVEHVSCCKFWVCIGSEQNKTAGSHIKCWFYCNDILLIFNFTRCCSSSLPYRWNLRVWFLLLPCWLAGGHNLGCGFFAFSECTTQVGRHGGSWCHRFFSLSVICSEICGKTRQTLTQFQQACGPRRGFTGSVHCVGKLADYSQHQWLQWWSYGEKKQNTKRHLSEFPGEKGAHEELPLLKSESNFLHSSQLHFIIPVLRLGPFLACPVWCKNPPPKKTLLSFLVNSWKWTYLM